MSSAAWLLVVSLVILAGPSAAGRSNYDERRAADVTRCEALDPSEYQTGLFFNPEGYRSLYVRSKCFQEVAVRYRDSTLCTHVRRRLSLFSSSWGYSASACRARVKEGVAADRRAIEEIRRQYRDGHMTLRDFRIELNGNGRDFDLRPSFAGERSGGYQLTVDVASPGTGSRPSVIHSDGYYVDTRAELRVFLRREEVQQLVPGFDPERPYTVRVTLTLSLPTGTVDAAWSDAFIEGAFPTSERSQSISRTIAFPGVRLRHGPGGAFRSNDPAVFTWGPNARPGSAAPHDK